MFTVFFLHSLPQIIVDNTHFVSYRNSITGVVFIFFLIINRLSERSVLKNKNKIYNPVAIPTILYSRETWTETNTRIN